MKTLTIKRLSIGSIFKLNLIGLVFGLLPLMIFFSILAVFGMDTVSWNGQPVIGIKALVVGPLIGVFIALIFTLLLSPLIWLGQLIFSKIKPCVVKYAEIEQSQD